MSDTPFRRPPLMDGYPISDPDEQAAIERVNKRMRTLHRHYWIRESMEVIPADGPEVDGVPVLGESNYATTIVSYRCECGDTMVDRHEGDQRTSMESASEDSAVAALGT